MFTYDCDVAMLLNLTAKKGEAPPRFELGISCLLDRRFNQLSHGAAWGEAYCLVYKRNKTLLHIPTSSKKAYVLTLLNIQYKF